MKKNIFLVLSVISLLFISSCSSSEDATTNKGDDQEIYIFDDVAADSTTTETQPVVETEPIPIDTVETIVSKVNEYIVQVGAFTTEERARKFVSQHQSQIEWKMSISYSTKVKYWVVQLPSFLTRAEAESVRNKLWLNVKFKDAFIVPEG